MTEYFLLKNYAPWKYRRAITVGASPVAAADWGSYCWSYNQQITAEKLREMHRWKVIVKEIRIIEEFP
jgi:hypothetical protein